jgi:hypothetical protein
MKDGNGQHDFESIAQLLHQQNAVLEVLSHHLAHVEATLFALAVKALSREDFCTAKRMKDYLQRTIYSDMMERVERNLTES